MAMEVERSHASVTTQHVATILFALASTLVCLAIFFGLANMNFSGSTVPAQEGLRSELARVNAQIETLSTAIDNGDIEGMYSTAGTTVELLLRRRAALTAELDGLRTAN